MHAKITQIYLFLNYLPATEKQLVLYYCIIALRWPALELIYKYRWQPRNGSDGESVAKILIMTIQVNLVPIPSEAGMRQHKFTWIVFKNFATDLLSKPFLNHHMYLFHLSLLGTHFFTAWILGLTLNLTSFHIS